MKIKRKKKTAKFIVDVVSVFGLICFRCNSISVSWHRHDYRSCPCGATSIDGGQDYQKIVAKSPKMCKLVRLWVKEKDLLQKQ